MKIVAIATPQGQSARLGLRYRESSMSKPGLDGRHRDKNDVISSKHGDILVRTLRKIYGQGFAAGYGRSEKAERTCGPIRRCYGGVFESADQSHNRTGRL